MMITGIVLNNRKYLPTNMDDVGKHFFLYSGFFVWEEKQKITKTIFVWPIVLHRGINGFFHEALAIIEWRQRYIFQLYTTVMSLASSRAVLVYQ